MSIIDGIVSVFNPIRDIIDNVSTTDEERLHYQNLLTKAENKLEAKYIDLEKKALDSKKEIITAELKQDDNYTKRARPTIVYGGLLILFLNHVALPWIAYFTGQQLPTIDLPSEFWLAWGGVTGVYAFGRTKEKMKK